MVDKITIKGCREDSVFSGGDTTLLKRDQLIEKMHEAFADKNLAYLVHQRIKINGVNNYNYTEWIENGVNCEILQPGGLGWQKGKMRLKVNVEVEFIPDEPEPKKTKPASPLDDLRKKIKEEK